MKPLFIFRHLDIEGPGYFIHFLERHGIHYRLVKVDQGDEIPRSLDNIGGLVFMGGSMSVNDDLPWIRQEISLIKRAVAAKLPILGHCLGGQLISKALGGEVYANPAKEIGWYDVEWVETRATPGWLSGLPVNFEVFHWHGETFTIPHGATNILRSHLCGHQAFVKGNILALQFHIEMTVEMVKEWVQQSLNATEIASGKTPGVQNSSQILNNLESKIMALHRVADIIYGHWLQLGNNEQLPVL